ncbi:uncharacterized protein N7511_002569 [Penicillium nucicola]|uniref:uncharacterized protein n=1 Tax=Penicillium nucicola TaxID=1850975 RepID=UPI002545357D|nr:uncharacterized protein N7511_002569 [Penicillium nucicola]KAJ5770518.1 hypothetical protein N7511_002569 [Penicillium nucicola]
MVYITVVTGVASGVGRAIAILYAHHGAMLICADLRPDIDSERSGQPPEISTHAPIKERDGKAAAEVETLVAEAVKQYGKLDM